MIDSNYSAILDDDEYDALVEELRINAASPDPLRVTIESTCSGSLLNNRHVTFTADSNPGDLFTLGLWVIRRLEHQRRVNEIQQQLILSCLCRVA